MLKYEYFDKLSCSRIYQKSSSFILIEAISIKCFNVYSINYEAFLSYYRIIIYDIRQLFKTDPT